MQKLCICSWFQICWWHVVALFSPTGKFIKIMGSDELLPAWNVQWWADSRFAPNQWETELLCNDVSHWLGANLQSALFSDVLNKLQPTWNVRLWVLIYHPLIKCSIMKSTSYYLYEMFIYSQTLQWHHNEHDGVSNHQPYDCLLNHLFRHR